MICRVFSDALKKGSSEKSLSFKNLINNQNKWYNKDNDLLDLTFNDDIMLDTVANNKYINSCQRTGAKNLSNKSDAFSSGNYSPISDDDKCWTTSPDSQSSPESAIFLSENRSDSRKKSETQLNIEKTSHLSDGRPVGDGGNHRFNDYCLNIDNIGADLLSNGWLVSGINHFKNYYSFGNQSDLRKIGIN